MQNFKRIVLEVILLCACSTSFVYSQSCPAQKQSSLKFTINNRRNQTGHWISQVKLKHGSNDQNSASPWTVQVEQSAKSCEGLDSVQLQATLISPPPKAGPGYELHKGIGYYKLHKDLKKWAEARQICQQEGGHLVIINSEEEDKVLQSMFAPVAEQLKTQWAFVGFHDLYTEGQYLTIFDEPLKSTGFYRWSSPVQPNNYNGNATHPGEDCGSIHINGGLNDANCEAKIPFICEQELWYDTPNIKLEKSECNIDSSAIIFPEVEPE
ncbi:hemolymph lipopolysaccharide-binding protein-like isoform X1 [Periplaneta americana]|uniref:hemolymph lipopolysaccharide-binding protein-like isoform X1 n=2 Tax=Periplaneta americana TaxID=6978 RepID=UPI0037E74582